MIEAIKPAVPNEGSKPEIDLSKYVPKEELDKISTQHSEVQKALNEAKLKLVDPEYIEFLESKKLAGDKALKQAEKEGAPTFEINALKAEVRSLQTGMQQITALLEVSEVEKKYTDFNELRGDIQKILEGPGQNLTIEQAYLLVKAQKGEKPAASGDKPKPAAKGSEKPTGSLPASGTTPKDYTDPTKAGMAAWDEVKAKHGLEGDII